jgi:hypothetical protein
MSGRAYSLMLMAALLGGLVLTDAIIRSQARWDQASADRARAAFHAQRAATESAELQTLRAEHEALLKRVKAWDEEGRDLERAKYGWPRFLAICAGHATR